MSKCWLVYIISLSLLCCQPASLVSRQDARARINELTRFPSPDLAFVAKAETLRQFHQQKNWYREQLDTRSGKELSGTIILF